MTAPKVIVVGGGLSGITAALDCAQRGAQVTLLEARGRLGGAAYSYERDGLRVDNGQHVFLRCCDHYQRLLQRIGADAMVTMQPRLDVAVIAPPGRLAHLRRNGLPAPLHLAASIIRYPFLSVRERLSLALTMQKLGRVDPDDPANDGRSFGSWLREHRQSVAAVEAIWELIARPTINLTADDCSLAQAAQVFRIGLLQNASSGDIGWAVKPLSDIHDLAARRALETAGVRVRTRSTVKSIEYLGADESEHPYRVTASDAAPADGSSQAAPEDTLGPADMADAIVIAVGPVAAARLIPDAAGLPVDFADKLGRSPIVNLHIVFDRTVLDHRFATGVQSPVQWMFDRTESSGLTVGQYVTVSLSAADNDLGAPAEQLRERYLPALAELLPKMRTARVENFFVSREHSATFRAAPGIRAYRPGPVTKLPGLVLAGAWTDTGWPATMEGAVRSGAAAAREAMKVTARTPGARYPEEQDRQTPGAVGVMR